jgi:hypothetical protein
MPTHPHGGHFPGPVRAALRASNGASPAPHPSPRTPRSTKPPDTSGTAPTPCPATTAPPSELPAGSTYAQAARHVRSRGG